MEEKEKKEAKVNKPYKYVPIEINEPIEYTYITENYGRAEFEFCPVFEDGVLHKVYITPSQQPDLDHGFVVTIKNYMALKGFYISDYSSLDPTASCWFGYWCEVHKTYCMRWYVPRRECRLWPVLHFDGLALEFWPIKVDLPSWKGVIP